MPSSDKTPYKSAELRHLRAFVAVAHSGNVSRAAEQIGLTQSRVSQQLKELEEALDTALFARVGRRLSLTPAGRSFRTHAEEILQRLEVAVRAIMAAPEGEDSHLRVGVVPACNTRFIPAILGIMSQRYPLCTLSVEEVSADEIERDLDAGRLDLGLGFLPHASPSIHYTPLLREKFRLILRADHPLAGSGALPMAALADLALVVLPQRFYMRQLIDQMMTTHRVRPRIRMELSSVPAIIRTVQESGLGTLLPPFSVAPAPDLVDLELLGVHASVEVGLMQVPVQGRNLPVERFVAAAVEVIERSLSTVAPDLAEGQ